MALLCKRKQQTLLSEVTYRKCILSTAVKPTVYHSLHQPSSGNAACKCCLHASSIFKTLQFQHFFATSVLSDELKHTGGNFLMASFWTSFNSNPNSFPSGFCGSTHVIFMYLVFIRMHVVQTLNMLYVVC